MTLDELAHWIADTRGGNRQGGAIWNAVRDRALDALKQAFEMGRAEQPALHELRDDQFLFAYPFRQHDIQVTTIRGICTVFADGSFSLVLLTWAACTTAPEPAMRNLITEWLRAEMADSIALARNLGASNVKAHDRAVGELAAEG